MILYLDTSALVKRYIREPESPQVKEWIAVADVAGSSLIARVEMAAVIGRLRRMKELSEAAAVQTLTAFRDHWPSYTRLRLTEATVRRADELAYQNALRGYDAVHLASALLWQEQLGELVSLATYDRQLGAAARTLGMVVLPPHE